ncbi:unnamed protein product [Rotaria magnacalcarata]|uniref:Uncharacterized protein n=1 Tax=Rotaria magnacalcarata TaxID=392030 RepID=A0A815VHF9_9BILA|nr:unnamed protein product [Rotaria magnacalcarata]CAF1634621.1 unnamed protein product [Rotaria magnacalcarata]CAF1927085.1 unnamed protein product [Rotaria magnacalcarata]CAF2018042.1 unnamed protein product [Rotaria magnacalcarata]CAF2049790.1 unnamed protein product [Rotaria magnacalcarata]
MINRDIRECLDSCVIDRGTNVETTHFTYIVRSLNLQDISEKAIKTPGNETTIRTESEARTASTKPDKIMAHDDLIPQQIEPLREKNSHEHSE